MSKIQIVMTADELVAKAKETATLKTLYVYGGLGQNGTDRNKKRAIASNTYNAKRSDKISATNEDTWFFDCVGLIKALLSGFNHEKTKDGKTLTYGGAFYWDNGIVDCGAKVMMNTYCTDVTTDFRSIQKGEAVWLAETGNGTDSHIGIYIGDGQVVECTPKWNDGVQISQMNDPKGTKYRTWTKHGKLPWVDYSCNVTKNTVSATQTTTVVNSSVASAKKYSKSLIGTYQVTTSINLRCDATPKSDLVVVLPQYTRVKCYGYYSLNGLRKWYLVQATVNNKVYTGFAHSGYLTKC